MKKLVGNKGIADSIRSKSNQAKLSPLDQVRLAEVEIARKVIIARKESEQIMISARKKAASKKQLARKSGIQKGEIIYKKIITRAGEEAQGIISQAQNKASALRIAGKDRMDLAVKIATDIILGLKKRSEKSDEY